MRVAAAVFALALAPCCLAQQITDPNFVVETIATPGAGTIGIDFGPGARLYVAEKRGRVLVMQPNATGGYDAPSVFADLTSFVDYSGESGMLGLTLDPDFASNRFMYLFYTTPGDQRLVRVSADATYNAISGSQTILISGFPRAATNHKAGDIGFRPGEPDYIYLSLGDDASPSQANNMNVYHGKMLRLNKANGEGLTTNPFYTVAGGTTSVQSRIWAFGFRNPFRIAFHPSNPVGNAIYSSENGGPSNMTTSLQDRVTWIQQGADAGWNSQGSTAGENSTFFNPVNPQNQECVLLRRDTSSMIGIDIAQGGPFSDQAFPGSAVLLCSNWLANGGTIYRFRLSGANHNVINTLAADGGVPFIRGLYGTDIKFGPDGALYFTQTGNGISTGTGYRVGRIRYNGNQPPVANFTTNPSPATGAAPLNVQFTDASTDPDGAIASRLWNFGNGQTSTATNPSVNYTTSGVYIVTLTVTDNGALQNNTQKTVTVLATPVANFTTNPNPAVGPSPLLVQFTDTSTDADGTITARLWNFGNGQTSTAPNPGMNYATPGVYTVTLTVTDNSSLQANIQRNVTVQARPVASFNNTPSPITGPSPLNVQFTDTSTDADGTIASRVWDFGNGQTSTAPAPSTTYPNPGNYTVTLAVTDNSGLTTNTQKPVNVYFATALTLTGQILDARTLAAPGMASATELRLYAADGTTPLPFAGGAGPNQNAIAVAAGGTFNTTVSIQLSANGVVVSAGEPAGDGMAAQFHGFTVAPTAPSHAANLAFRLSNLAVGGRITAASQPAVVDIGAARGMPNELYAFAGGRDYLPASGIAATSVSHRAVSDELGFYYIPILAGNGSSDFYFDYVGDTGAATCVAQTLAEFLPASGLVQRNVVLVAQSAPGTRDDLSGIAVSLGVDYDTQIQPIFSVSCAGCHAATGGRAGLSLAPGTSYAALVNVVSGQLATTPLVQPGNAGASYLFDKINAHRPQVGVRMGQGAIFTPAQQALIRDWINQGALVAAAPAPPNDPGSGDGCAAAPSAAIALAALAGVALLALRQRRRSGGAPQARA